MNMLLSNLYRELSKEPNSPEAFIANVIYTRYSKNRKKILEGLYNIINGGPKHYWAPCHVTFAPFQMKTILATPANPAFGKSGDRIKEIDIENLPFYA